jgi:2-oxoisovalerate dehydrogenase E1 component
MDSVVIDGNNVLTVYDTIKGVREYCIEKQKPYLIECMTFRMRGHEEASGTKYVPKELFDEWSLKDPIKNFETFLIAGKVLSAEDVENIRAEQKQKIEDELKIGFESKEIVVNTENELKDVYAIVKRETSNVNRESSNGDSINTDGHSGFTIHH